MSSITNITHQGAADSCAPPLRRLSTVQAAILDVLYTLFFNLFFKHSRAEQFALLKAAEGVGHAGGAIAGFAL